jgi:hypothetical protein
VAAAPKAPPASPAHRVQTLDHELGEMRRTLLAATALDLLALFGVGLDTAPTLLVNASDIPRRLAPKLRKNTSEELPDRSLIGQDQRRAQ